MSDITNVLNNRITLTFGCKIDDLNNTFLGDHALDINTLGFNNTGIGTKSLASNKIGNNNTAVGAGSMYYNNGSVNTAFGANALENNQTGNYNTAIGANADIDSSGNIFNYSTAIGYNAKITKSNQMVLGGKNNSDVFPEVCVPGNLQVDGYNNGVFIKYEYISGDSDHVQSNIDISDINLLNTKKYVVLPTVYYGYSGSGGTYNAKNTSGALHPIVISNITYSQFTWNLEKSTGDNVNIYIIFIIIFNKDANYTKNY